MTIHIKTDPQLIFNALTKDMPHDHWMIEKYTDQSSGSEMEITELLDDILMEIHLASDTEYSSKSGDYTYKIASPKSRKDLYILEKLFEEFFISLRTQTLID